MLNSLILLLQDSGPGGIQSLLGSLLPFLLIIVVFYFLILRPQQKRQKTRTKLLESVKKGDRIVTAGGIHGVIEGVEDKIILVKIADNVKVKCEKSSVTTIVGVTDSTPTK